MKEELWNKMCVTKIKEYGDTVRFNFYSYKIFFVSKAKQTKPNFKVFFLRVVIFKSEILEISHLIVE